MKRREIGTWEIETEGNGEPTGKMKSKFKVRNKY